MCGVMVCAGHTYSLSNWGFLPGALRLPFATQIASPGEVCCLLEAHVRDVKKTITSDKTSRLLPNHCHSGRSQEAQLEIAGIYRILRNLQNIKRDFASLGKTLN